jgi:hypothetical protein
MRGFLARLGRAVGRQPEDIQLIAQERRAVSFGTFGMGRVVVLAGVTATLSGCIASPLAKRSAAFSTAATATITQTTNAYQLVNQAYQDSQTATLVATFDTAEFQSKNFHPFLPPADLAVRTQVLDGLQQYAALLAEVSGDQPIADLETQTKASGDALAKMQQDDFKSFKVSSDEQNIAETAVVALGGLLIEHERARALPGILAKMNPPIQRICALLENDIGTVGSAGLASSVHRHYDDQITAEQKYIRDNTATMSAAERRAEIETLPRLVVAQRQADQALAATRKSLAALAAAHAALTDTRTQKNAPAFELELSQMVQSAQSLSSFYSSLESK